MQQDIAGAVSVPYYVARVVVAYSIKSPNKNRISGPTQSSVAHSPQLPTASAFGRLPTACDSIRNKYR